MAVLVLIPQTLWAENLGIITGGEKGTYFRFGQDLRKLGQGLGFDLQVYPSSGSVNNVYAVFKAPMTQMGIVQSDVLVFVYRVQTDARLKRIAKKIKMVFPLYNEEVHLVGRPELADFNDLDGKRVAIGKEGSGTFLTASLLFKVSGVTPSQMVTVGTDDALSRLKRGEIDAMFYVCGLPVTLFRNDIHEGDGLKLLPITNKSITEFYPRAKVPEGTYSWQKAVVPTVAVKAVLISFDFRRNNCEYVGRFAKSINENIDWLRENGHPKWKSVDLDYQMKGWGQYDCVKKYLEQAETDRDRKPANINPVLEAIQDLL